MEASSFSIDIEDDRFGHNKIVPLSTNSSVKSSEQWKKEEEEKAEEKEQTKPFTLCERLGSEDFSCEQVWRSSMAELLGTAALVFMTNTVIICSNEAYNSPKLIIGTINPIIIAFIILATIPISGGHINPIVSVSFGLMGRISPCRATIYVLAQCIGGVIGALALKAVLDSETEHNFSLGGCTIVTVTSGPDGPITAGLDTARAFYLEVICSFVFLFFSRWMAFDAKKADMFSRLVYCFGIGIVVGFNGFVSSTITGVKGYARAGVNPASCLGPAIVRGGYLWHCHWIHWIGPAIASMCFYLYSRIIAVENPRPKEIKHDFINILKACCACIR